MAWAAVVLAEIYARTGGDPALAWQLRQCAAVGTIMPPIAVLGAKRPQHVAWQIVVATLWVVLALPVGEAIVRGDTVPGDLHPARQAFVLILVAVGVVNYAPTRNLAAALLYAAAQLAVLADQLRTELLGTTSDRVAAGLVLAIAALALAVWTGRARARVSSPMDRAWLDFRNSYGLFWSARVAARLNEAATQHQWPLRLRWRGIASNEKPSAEGSASHEREMFERMLDSLMLRFVSPSWIAGRKAAVAASLRGSPAN